MKPFTLITTRIRKAYRKKGFNIVYLSEIIRKYFVIFYCDIATTNVNKICIRY